MRLFLVLTASCVLLLLSGTSNTKPMLDNISTMYETVIQKIDAYQLTVEPSASVDEIEDPASRPPGGLFDPIEITPQCHRTNSNSTNMNITASAATSRQHKRRRVIDITWVNRELPSLELRLNELWNVVDIFFLSESTISWKAEPFKNQTVKPKPLAVSDNIQNFEKFQSKMAINVVPPEVSYNTKYDGPYAIEMAQRDYEWDALVRMVNPQPDDLLIFADLDEIPRPDIIERMACDDSNVVPSCLHTQASFYYYNYKCHIKVEWTRRPRVIAFRDGRNARCRKTIPNASTHCSSCFGTLDLVKTKILSNADPMEDTPEQLNNASILDRVRNCKDVYLRKDQNPKMDLRESVDYDKIPLIVAKHPERWPYLLGRGPLYEDEPEAASIIPHESSNTVSQHAVLSQNESENAVAINSGLTSAITENACQAFDITPTRLPDPTNPKYIIFFPRAGMGECSAY